MMAEYPYTGSSLAGAINTGLSTQILVKVDNVTVGAIQSLEIRHSRALERVKELGTDGILEIVPNRATEYTVTVTRIVFDKMRLPEAFARGFVNIKSQLIPFDIVIIDKSNGADPSTFVTHILSRCWFTGYNPKYDATSFIISESAELWCEDISTTLGTSAENGAIHGNFVTENHETEFEADRGAGGRRGTMDVPGIFDITRQAFGE